MIVDRVAPGRRSQKRETDQKQKKKGLITISSDHRSFVIARHKQNQEVKKNCIFCFLLRFTHTPSFPNVFADVHLAAESEGDAYGFVGGNLDNAPLPAHHPPLNKEETRATGPESGRVEDRKRAKNKRTEIRKKKKMVFFFVDLCSHVVCMIAQTDKIM